MPTTQIGLQTNDGIDIAYLLKPGTSSTITGYNLSNNTDIGTILQSYTNGPKQRNTGYISESGTDLSNLFRPRATITISGTGTYTIDVSGTLYTITFTSGTNTISVDLNATFLVVAVGGGGGGGYSSSGGGGGGGGGGGYGLWEFWYTANTSYSTSIGVGGGSAGSGGSTTFKTTIGALGITAAGGIKGSVDASRANNTTQSTSTKDASAPGTLTAYNGGYGGGVAKSGGNASGYINIFGLGSFIYSGGGASGTDTTSTTSNGGNPGVNGIGATTRSTSTSTGQNATTHGSGAGGANRNAGTAILRTGGTGARGVIIIYFSLTPDIIDVWN